MSADLLGDGNVKVTFVAGDGTIPSISAPVAATLNAGQDLQTVITKEGLDISPEQSPVENTSLASTAETEDAGTVKHGVNVTYKRKAASVDDIGWNTLVPGTLGYLAVRRNLPHATAWAAGQEAEIYPVRCGTRKRQPPKLNEAQQVQQQMFVHTQADDNATVA